MLPKRNVRNKLLTNMFQDLSFIEPKRKNINKQRQNIVVINKESKIILVLLKPLNNNSIFVGPGPSRVV